MLKLLTTTLLALLVVGTAEAGWRHRGHTAVVVVQPATACTNTTTSSMTTTTTTTLAGCTNGQCGTVVLVAPRAGVFFRRLP